MTLVVAMKADGGIVLASDSRGTVGDPRGLTAINDTYQKIFPLGQCGIAFSGASEYGQTLLDEFNSKGIQATTTIDETMPLVRTIAQQAFDQWMPKVPPNQRPGVILTLAGYRHTDSVVEPMIYLMLSQQDFAPQLFGHMPCLSGVPQYAVYLTNRFYDPAISLDKAKGLAAYLIGETASQDPKVGGPIHMAEITAENGYNAIEDEEVLAIQSANGTLSQGLRQFFLQGGSS